MNEDRQFSSSETTPQEETTGARLSLERGANYFNDLKLRLAMSAQMQVGHGLAMRVQLVNQGGKLLSKIELEFTSEDNALLQKSAARTMHRLCAGETSDQVLPVQLEPQRPGERMLAIQARVGDCGDGQPRALESFIVLRIQEQLCEGTRHFNINVEGPRIEVNRSMSGQAEQIRSIGNDERIITENRPEIRIHEAEQTAPDQAAALIQFDVPLWLNYERTLELLQKTQQNVPFISKFRWVEQEPGLRIDPQTLKRALPGAFVLEVEGGCRWRRYILLFRPTLRVGRSRSNDYILRFAPYADPRTDPMSNSISRELGCFEFQAGRLRWRASKERLPVAGEPDGGGRGQVADAIDLEGESEIELVQGMSFRVRGKRHQEETTRGLDEYRNAMSKLPGGGMISAPGEDFGLAAAHNILNVSLDRKSNPNGETIVWLPRMAWLGQSPGNSLRFQGEGVQPIHARLIYHNGRLALEDQQSPGGTWIEARRLEPGELALLRPGNRIRLGEAQLLFKPYDPQEYLEHCKRLLQKKARAERDA